VHALSGSMNRPASPGAAALAQFVERIDARREAAGVQGEAMAPAPF
jgi:hypothetical protein